jgi:hypothetical protein
MKEEVKWLIAIAEVTESRIYTGIKKKWVFEV